MVMTSLRNSALQLRVNAHMCWMEALILPPIFDRAHPSLLKVMNISHPPRCGVVLRHLKTVGERWENVSDLGTREDLKVCLQSVVLGCCAVVGTAINGGRCQPSAVRSLLSTSAFVVTDTGKIVTAGSVCVDLDDHVSEFALAPPFYLPAHLHCVLEAAGSTSMSMVAPPQVKVKGRPPFTDMVMATQIKRLCLSSELSDVELVHPSNQTIYHAHKLVLGLACPAFHVMFSGGFSEAMGGSNTIITLPEWADEYSVKYLLKYLYGVVGNPLVGVGATQDTITSVCTLLRLADFYNLEHLKSLAEVWLSTNEIIDVFNVVGLLTHAHACRAKQLMEFTSYCCREMSKVVMSTDEWHELDPVLQRRVWSHFKQPMNGQDE